MLATIAQSPVDGTALMSATTFHALVSATIISLLLTPYFVAVAPQAGSWLAQFMSRSGSRRDTQNGDDVLPGGDSVSTPADAILIIGFGPAGQRVAQGLIDPHQGRMVVVDLNPDNISIANRYGLAGVLGDATQTEILEHAGIYRARVVVVVLPDHNTARHLIYQVRDLAPNVHVIVRCRHHVRHWQLLNAGAHEIVDEEDQVGKKMAARVRRVMR